MQPGPPPSRLLAGRYRLQGLLGRGGMAEVYAAYDERLGRNVAVKFLRSGPASDPAERERFQREARTAARFSHPSVVAIYDTGVEENRPYIVMERLGGETFADRVRTGPQDQHTVAVVADYVLDALTAAHSQGLVHRDIKPANVLLTDDGAAKVADFGIAKTMADDGQSDLTRTGLVIGTVAYLAPEQIAGTPASARSDIYSLGVMMYEALAGRKPFIGDNALAQARAAHEGNPTPLSQIRPDVDRRLIAVVERAMARHPEDRYSSASQMRAALRATGLVDAAGDHLDHTQAVGQPGGGTMLYPAGGTQFLGPAGSGDPSATRIQPPTRASQRTTLQEATGRTTVSPTRTKTTTVGGPPPDRYDEDRGRGRSRGWIWLLVIVILLLLAGLAYAAINGDFTGGKDTPTTTLPPATTTKHHGSTTTGSTASTTTSTSTTSTSTTTAVDTVGNELKQYANQLIDNHTTDGADQLAAILENVAGTPPHSQTRLKAANSAMTGAGTLYTEGKITLYQYNRAAGLLEAAGASKQYPSAPSTTTTSTSTAPTTSTPTTTGGNQG